MTETKAVRIDNAGLINWNDVVDLHSDLTGEPIDLLAFQSMTHVAIIGMPHHDPVMWRVELGVVAPRQVLVTANASGAICAAVDGVIAARRPVVAAVRDQIARQAQAGRLVLLDDTIATLTPQGCTPPLGRIVAAGRHWDSSITEEWSARACGHCLFGGSAAGGDGDTGGGDAAGRRDTA